MPLLLPLYIVHLGPETLILTMIIVVPASVILLVPIVATIVSRLVAIATVIPRLVAIAASIVVIVHRIVITVEALHEAPH